MLLNLATAVKLFTIPCLNKYVLSKSDTYTTGCPSIVLLFFRFESTCKKFFMLDLHALHATSSIVTGSSFSLLTIHPSPFL